MELEPKWLLLLTAALRHGAHWYRQEQEWSLHPDGIHCHQPNKVLAFPFSQRWMKLIYETGRHME